MARSSEAQGNVELHPPQSRQPLRITAVTPISFRQVNVCCKALFDAVIDGTDPPVKCVGNASDFGCRFLHSTKTTTSLVWPNPSLAGYLLGPNEKRGKQNLAQSWERSVVQSQPRLEL
jgi:hypothetical protein